MGDFDESEEIERLRAEHRRAIETIRSSFQYRLGDTLVRSVSSVAGAKAAPRKMLELFREARAHRQSSPLPPTFDGAVRRSTQAASILDEFSHSCLAPELELLPLEKAGPLGNADLLLCESAWQGNGGIWAHAFSVPDSDRARALRRLLDDANARKIPTVFWNKEDPPNFETFIESAHWFDHVFTTDSGMLSEYRLRLGHDRVYCLPFAAQPRLHNPVQTTPHRLDRVAFSGSWRVSKYPERAADTRMLLDAAAELKCLDLYDRFAAHPNTALHFPADYDGWKQPPLPYKAMAQKYADYAGFLTVNSAPTSPTMVSRRVYEILGSGTPVISAPSKSIDSVFQDVVLVASNRTEARAHIEAVTTNGDYRAELGQRGYRFVHEHNTYSDRVDDMLAAIGLDNPVTSRRPRVVVVLVSNRPERFDAALANYQRQSYTNVELVFVTNSSEFDPAAVDNRVAELGGQTLHVDERATLAECLNAALEQSDAPYFAKFDDDDHYGEHYLSDQMLAFNYVDAAVIGKAAHFVHFERDDSLWLRFDDKEFQTVNKVQGGTLVVDRLQIGRTQFQPVKQGTDTRFLADVQALGLTIFSTDRFNFVLERRADVSTHTWQIDERDIRRAARQYQGRPTL